MFTTNLLPIKTGQYGSIGVEIFKGGIQDEIEFGHFFFSFKKNIVAFALKSCLI